MYDVAAVDIGNSTVRTGYFKNGQLETVTTVRTKGIRKKVNLQPSTTIRVSSVVPRIHNIIRQDYRNAQIIAHSDLSYSGECGHIGIDRLINAYAAQVLYSQKNVIVVDFGTAITISVILGKEFNGGLIIPGYQTMMSSLRQTTAALPQVSADVQVKGMLYIETDQAIRAGCFNLISRGIGSIVDELKQAYKISRGVVATGGHCLTFHEQIPVIDIVNPTLLLEGLYLLK